MSRSTKARLLVLAVVALSATPAVGAAQEENIKPLIPHVYELRSNERDTDSAATVSSTRGSFQAVLNSNVVFTKDSATITPAATRRLEEIAGRLRGKKAGHLVIVGHTDDLGSAEHGLELSQRRAQAVADQLGQLDRITVKVEGRGETQPAAPNTSEANRAKNRRVGILYQEG
ncbi:OmpA family protein [Luteococcus sp.]|uniref:OmpA family protein n=1 Tax=Luteococcus sp. TaxID=1969402 RepID=UPI003735F688